MIVLDWLIDILINLSYFALIIAILAGSFGIPIPEEVVLLIAGYLSSIAFFKLPYVILVCFFTMIIGDNIGYYLGYRGSTIVLWIFRTTKTSWLKDHLQKHPCKTIFFSRFLSGFRVFFPIAAGSIKMPWKIFFIFDFLAVLILVPVFVLLGYYLQPHFDAIINGVLRFDKVIISIVVALVAISFVGFRAIKHAIFKHLKQVTKTVHKKIRA